MTRVNYCFLIFILITSITACRVEKPEETSHRPIDIQGHRGARGLMPENTLPAFRKALELGITTLELDLAVTRDRQLLISHEPYMNHYIALDSLGESVPKEDEQKHNIYQMSYTQIKKYDVGSKFVKRFPDQQKMVVHKPLLEELVSLVNQFESENPNKVIRYNIEIKCLPMGDNVFHPTPEVFSKLVYDFIIQNMNPKHVNVQSFDFRVLRYFHETYPEIELAVLIENTESIDENLEELGFTPQIYSCYHPFLDQEKINKLHDMKMKVIPWTVNEEEDMKKLIHWGVDGIISDYPDRVLNVIAN
ncbi:glycerophosphodiester phosphodiesterase [Reichenbachiella agariperforans]|nr:glycerophosphodiester phosphodiesterase family protein [Reichenbachiella agariperforans]MBU2914640.1 glycerophosphodiester phosphodiesterase [Reichenbachiella agariperforans]